MALSFAEQMAKDFDTALPTISEVLQAEYGVASGEHVRIDDIASALGRASPNIIADTSMAVALGQKQAARELIASGLSALKEVDPFLFNPIPSRNRFTILRVRVLGLTDLASAAENTRLLTVDDLRRGWHHFCKLAQSKGIPIPSEQDASRFKAPSGGGVRASRRSFPRVEKPVDGRVGNFEMTVRDDDVAAPTGK